MPPRRMESATRLAVCAIAASLSCVPARAEPTAVTSLASVSAETGRRPSAPPSSPRPSDLNLPAELPIPTGYTTERALDIEFDQPLCIATPPGEDDRLFVCEKTGKLIVVVDLQSGPQREVFLDVPKLLADNNSGVLAQKVEWGLLAVAFHPRYAENGYLYVAYDFTVRENGKAKNFNRLSRFSVSADNPNRAAPASEVPLITQLDQASNHNGADLQFGPDGYLYYTKGDEGGGDDKYDNARYINKNFHAAIYRIDVDCAPENLPPNPHSQASYTYPSAVHSGGYRVPRDNPFVGIDTFAGRRVRPENVRTEAYAVGLRNPWRIAFDEPTGRCFISDVGQNQWEEISLLEPGGHYGWSYFEANHDGPRVRTTPRGLKTVRPIYEYGRKSPEPFNGKCVVGGLVYRGHRMTELVGKYLLADCVSNRIWALSQQGERWGAQFVANTTGQVVSFGIDPRDGEVLLANCNGGRIEKLVRSGRKGEEPPPLLSQTGAFKDLRALEPADCLVDYEPNVSFWSDHAKKSRWFALNKQADRIGFREEGAWRLPNGTVWVKHFDIEAERGNPGTARRLETRFLVKTTDGCYGITYKWREDQTDAELVPESGIDTTLEVSVDGQPRQQPWRFPSRSECLACHTSVAGDALAFNTLQLNKRIETGAGHQNQLAWLSRAGYFTKAIPGNAERPAYAAADDESQDLEWRVRSYLAVNCVQCHQPGGVSQGHWDARPHLPLETANLVNGPLVDQGGDRENRWAVPGDPRHSMVLQRLTGRGPKHMPPLATFEENSEAIELLHRWITQLQTAD